MSTPLFSKGWRKLHAKANGVIWEMRDNTDVVHKRLVNYINYRFATPRPADTAVFWCGRQARFGRATQCFENFGFRHTPLFHAAEGMSGKIDPRLATCRLIDLTARLS